jgi:hypothetical protein
MRRPSLYCAALAAAGLLAVPAAASASSSLYAGPVKVKGYSVSLYATDGGASDTLGVTAVKRSGGSQQMHSWSFPGVSVSIKGAKAMIKGDLGRYGKLNARIVAPVKAKGTVPAGCTGTPGSTRKGELTGAKLVLDSTFFRKFAPKSMKAMIIKSGKLNCSGDGNGGSGGNGGGTPSGLTLMSTVDGADGQLMVNVVKTAGKVTQQVTRMDAASATAPATVFHMISAAAGAAGLDAAADLSSATAAAAGPFLSGTLSFAGEAMGSMATGAVSGDFTARFDSIGAQSLPAGNDAMLMQR